MDAHDELKGVLKMPAIAISLKKENRNYYEVSAFSEVRADKVRQIVYVEFRESIMRQFQEPIVAVKEAVKKFVDSLDWEGKVDYFVMLSSDLIARCSKVKVLPEGYWTKEKVDSLLDRSDTAVEKAVIAIYGLQTEQEKYAEHNVVNNGVGFMSVHTEFLTSVAEQLKKGRHLSEKQMAIVRPMMKKYHRQLTMISNKEL